jgi:hypothetical protein
MLGCAFWMNHRDGIDERMIIDEESGGLVGDCCVEDFRNGELSDAGEAVEEEDEEGGFGIRGWCRHFGGFLSCE